MSDRYQPQGWGPILPGRGVDIVEMLDGRVGKPTIVELVDGRRLKVLPDGWGRDFGEDWEHVFLRGVSGDAELHLVMTSAIQRVLDPADDIVLHQRATDSLEHP